MRVKLDHRFLVWESCRNPDTWSSPLWWGSGLYKKGIRTNGERGYSCFRFLRG